MFLFCCSALRISFNVMFCECFGIINISCISKVCIKARDNRPPHPSQQFPREINEEINLKVQPSLFQSLMLFLQNNIFVQECIFSLHSKLENTCITIDPPHHILWARASQGDAPTSPLAQIWQVLENKLKPNQVCLPTLFVLSDAAAPNVDKCASFQLKLPKLM